LIARRVRELSIFSEIVLPHVKPAEIRDNQVAALILSGGPARVYEKEAPDLDSAIFEM